MTLNHVVVGSRFSASVRRCVVGAKTGRCVYGYSSYAPHAAFAHGRKEIAAPAACKYAPCGFVRTPAAAAAQHRCWELTQEGAFIMN